ncbi:MAG: hypothetical protein IT535_08045 [Bauldia sp.]|nr:hypothetical protein [Bauldia sp.]
MFWNLVWRRPRQVVCLGLETALAAYLASFLVRLKYVFDDADRLALIFKWPAWVRAALEQLEKRVAGRSSAHIVPGYGRYPYRHDRMVRIVNMPDTDQVRAAREWRLPDQPASSLVLYVNGWIDRSRGAEFIERIIERLDQRGGVRVLLAAKSDTYLDGTLRKRTCVMDLGTLPQVEALAYYRLADLVVTFYDPDVPINRYAEANKWGDCVAMGVPFVVNEEVRTAEEYVAAGAAFSVPYGDVEAFMALIETLIENPAELERARSAIGDIKFVPFEEALLPVWDRLSAKSGETGFEPKQA